jgi:nucleotide-binding universal stress UspA family protein
VRTRRILVALDGSPESRAALAAAARLGIPTGAELSGLFVEDVELLRLAALPFTVEVGFASAGPHPLDPSDVERRFRLAAEEAREALREVAAASGLPSRFRVARGRVVPELLSAAGEADVVATGKRSGRGPAGRRLGGTARGLIAHVPSPILVGGVRGLAPGPAVVITASSRVPDVVLRFASLLAGAFRAPEIVVIAGEGGTEPSRAELEGLPVRRRSFPSISSGGVRALREVAIASSVVLVRPEGTAGHELLVALAEAITCPVFVIGPRGLAELLSA